MLTYSFEDRKGKSKFEYLYEQIREDILKGTLKPGEKLPSKRALAEHLGISVITVEGAYGQLLDEIVQLHLKTTYACPTTSATMQVPLRGQQTFSILLKGQIIAIISRIMKLRKVFGTKT